MWASVRAHLFNPVFFFFLRASQGCFIVHDTFNIEQGHIEELFIYVRTYGPYVFVHGTTGHANQGSTTHTLRALSLDVTFPHRHAHCTYIKRHK